MTVASFPVSLPVLAGQVAAQLSRTELLGVGLGGGMVAPDAVNGAAQGSLAAWRAEDVCVTQFGARGGAVVGADGGILQAGADDAAAFALGFAWLAGGPGRRLHIPAGCYNLSSLSMPLEMPDGATVKGAGMHRSRIVWNDAAGQNLFVTRSVPGQDVRDIAFEDLTVTGSCAAHWAAAQGGYPFLLDGAHGVALRRVCSEWSRGMGMALRHCDNVAIEQPLVRYAAYDGISVTACRDVSILGAVVESTGDDAISWHADTSETVPHGSLLVSGFRIRGTGGGINALGAKMCVINAGVLELVRFQGISIGGAAGATEGYTSTFGVAVTDVVIRDMLDASLAGDGAAGCRALCVNNAPMQAGDLADAPGLGGVPLAGHVDGNGPSAITGIGTGITISNVQVLVGRSAVAQYSAYGFGEMFTRHGWADPAVPDAALQATGLACLTGTIRDLTLQQCLFEGGGGAVGVYLAPDVRLLAAGLHDCTFRDFSRAMIGGNGLPQDIRLSGGVADLDPYLRAPGRAVVAGQKDGSWNAGAAAPILLAGAPGVTVTGLALRNAAGVGDADTVCFRDVKLHCQPEAVGAAGGNKGIGVVPPAGLGFMLVHEVSDPRDAAFGTIAFLPALDAVDRPATGLWLAGQFVRKTPPSASNGSLLLGWMRLTTGTGTVDAVDWAAVYAATHI